jgi:phage shock protein A
MSFGSDPGELIERLEKLRRLLPVFAQEVAAARREAARLRSQNATLQRRIVELEARPPITREVGAG